jgi:hypothetical protein
MQGAYIPKTSVQVVYILMLLLFDYSGQCFTEEKE